MKYQSIFWPLLILLFHGQASQAQNLYMPVNIQRAYANQTRSMDGQTSEAINRVRSRRRGGGF